jgi:hypothetical protein
MDLDIGFTSDAAGANLPNARGPWYEEIEPGVCVVGTDDDPVAQAVRQDGFHIVTSGPTTLSDRDRTESVIAIDRSVTASGTRRSGA